MKFKVKTPNTSFNGKRHGVQFLRGEAIAELEKHVVAEFKRWGYHVEELVEKAEEKVSKKKQNKKNEE